MAGTSSLGLSKVLADVRAERLRQISIGYTAKHDSFHSVQRFIQLANQQFTSPATMEGRASWYSRDTFIKAIALLVAGVEEMDRRARLREVSAQQDAGIMTKFDTDPEEE